MARAAAGARCRGQAMVEFVCVMVPLLLLIFGALQFGLIYHAKITLNYAAYETARAGSLNGARMLFMENAYERTMAALYTNSLWNPAANPGDLCTTPALDIDNNNGGYTTAANMTLAHVACGKAVVNNMINTGNVRILLINPSTESFDDFGENFSQVRDFDPSSDQSLATTRVIPNDNLLYRSAQPGGASGQSIHDANLIKVHVSHCYRLIVPLVSTVITQLMTVNDAQKNPNNPEVGTGYANAWGFGPLAGGFGANCAANGGIPLYSHSVMRMHSPAVEELVACRGWCN